MDIKKLNKSGRLSEWTQMVSQCRNSGKTVSAWCAEQGMNPKTYYYRLKRVCEAIPEATRPDNLPLHPGEENPAFAEIVPFGRCEKRGAAITVRFGNVEMEIRNGTDAATIEAVLGVLSRIC